MKKNERKHRLSISGGNRRYHTSLTDFKRIMKAYYDLIYANKLILCVLQKFNP